MRTKFIISFLFTSSTLFFASHTYAGGNGARGSEDLPAHPPIRQAPPVKPNLSASEGLPLVQKPVAPLSPLSQSAPAAVQRPEPWTNEWEKAVFLHVHNTNELRYYQGRIATRVSIQTLKRMRSVLLERSISSLTMSQLGELTHLKLNSPFRKEAIEKENFLKIIDFYIENLQPTIREEEAKFDGSRVEWHQRQLDAAHQEFEEANRVEGEVKPLSIQVVENWDKISRHLHMYFAFHKQAQKLTEGLLASAFEYFKKFLPKQLVASQSHEVNKSRGMEERSQRDAPVAPDISQPASISLAASLTSSEAQSMQGSLGSLISESGRSRGLLYASASSAVPKPGVPDSVPSGSQASRSSFAASPAASAASGSQQLGSLATVSPSPAKLEVRVDAAASVASAQEEDEEEDGVLVDSDEPGYSYPKTLVQKYADSAQRTTVKCVRFAIDSANAVAQFIS